MPTRQDFFFAIGLAGIVSEPNVARASALSSTKSPDAQPRLDFDNSKFEAILNRPARHRQCFAATTDSYGQALDMMSHSIESYSEALQEGPNAMHAAAVLYHGTSVMMGYGNKAWNEFVIPFLLQPPAASSRVRPGQGNPYYSDILNLVEQGSSFFICHNAFWSNVYMLAQGLKKSPISVYEAIMNDLVPNALLVPSGVMAINACQESKFTYIQVSV